MIGKQIRRLRDMNQMSQAELADKLHLKQSTIANYEKNVRTPKLEVLIKIADYFNVTIDSLVSDESILLSSNVHQISNYDWIKQSDVFLNYLIEDKLKEAEEMILNLLNHMSLEIVFSKLFRFTLSKLGWLWEVGAITISKEHQISYEITRMINHYTSECIKNQEVQPSSIKIIGMVVPGEKHNIGLKMMLSILEINGYSCQYIGEAVPMDDLKAHINEGPYNYLVLSITNRYLSNGLCDILDEVQSINTMVVGSGTSGLNLKQPHVKGTYKSYEKCLEAFL